MRKVLCLLSAVWLCGNLSAQLWPVHPVEVELVHLSRQGDWLEIDANVDLTRVRLTPDCSVYLNPVLTCEDDSLSLPPLLINGPQTDRMYRRQRSLGRKHETIPPYVILREGQHPLPRINYRLKVPFAPWMLNAALRLSNENCNCDLRLGRFEMSYHRRSLSTDTLYITETVERLVHDTLYLASTSVATVQPATAGIASIPASGPCLQADIYFPTNGTEILPEHPLNREVWTAFTALLDSISRQSDDARIGIEVIGYASPEGGYKFNEALALRRARAMEALLERKYGIDATRIQLSFVAEDWAGLTERIGSSSLAHKEEALRLIRTTGIFAGREKLLQDLHRGDTYRYLAKEFFPRLRKVTCRVVYVSSGNALNNK